MSIFNKFYGPTKIIYECLNLKSRYDLRLTCKSYCEHFYKCLYTKIENKNKQSLEIIIEDLLEIIHEANKLQNQKNIDIIIHIFLKTNIHILNLYFLVMDRNKLFR